MGTDNPVHGTIRFADGKRERRLTDCEYQSFGQALQRGEEVRSGRPRLPRRASLL
jgi:hypothetical protein